jgi:hypothetical protein
LNAPMVMLLPIRTQSESNLREHFFVKAKRAKAQRSATLKLCEQHLAVPAFPCVVKLTRVAPRVLDSDNLARCFKAIRDSIAEFLGVDDRDPRVHYLYDQEKGAPKHYAVRVEVTPSAVVVTEVRYVA